MPSDTPHKPPSPAKLTRLLLQWKQAVIDQWERFQEDDRLHDEATGPGKSIIQNREFTDAHFLVMAIRLILRLDDLVSEVLGLEETEELSRLRGELRIVKRFRNYGEHIDKYVIGVGDHRFKEPGIFGLHVRDGPTTAVFMIGGEELALESAVASAIELADYQHERVNPGS